METWILTSAAHKAGEDVIIGIVDSGIWPESLSFSDRTGTKGNPSKNGKLSYHQIPGWHGAVCQESSSTPHTATRS